MSELSKVRLLSAAVFLTLAALITVVGVMT